MVLYYRGIQSLGSEMLCGNVKNCRMVREVAILVF